jgi:hypothetical protein
MRRVRLANPWLDYAGGPHKQGGNSGSVKVLHAFAMRLCFSAQAQTKVGWRFWICL